LARRTQEAFNRKKRRTALSRCILVVDGKKPCSKCREVLPVENFYKSKKSFSGYKEECKDCKRKVDKPYTKANQEKRRQQKMAWRHANPEKIKKQQREYYRKRPELLKAKAVKYKQMLKQATPKWLTKEQWSEILKTYAIARELSWLSESRLVVDHIIPLRGENICGLHVPENLQIIPESLNVRKGNSFGT
jgi:hypothetical protein